MSVYSKVIRGFQILKIGSRDPGHAQLWVVLWSVRRRGTSSMSRPYTKFEADSSIRSRGIGLYLGILKFRNWVTWPSLRPLRGRFYGPYVGEVRPPSLYRICSGLLNSFKSYWGGPKIWKLGHVTSATPTYGRFLTCMHGGVRPLCVYQIWSG